jgi:hypothetical protein
MTPHRSRRRWLSLLIATAVAAISLAGCGFPDRRGAADAIDKAIGTMPGVADTDIRYDTSFDGGAYFDMTVTLTAQTSDDQGAAVARTFFEQVIAADFTSFQVQLELHYQRPGAAAADSVLNIPYHFVQGARGGPSPDAVAETAAWWFDVAHSPAVTSAAVTLPLDDIDAQDGSYVGVTVPVDADDAVLTDLIRRHPQLNSARWNVVAPSPPYPFPPRSYTSTGRLLDHHTRLTWKRIVDQLQPDDGAEASTQIPPENGQPPTTVDIGWGLDSGRDGDFERVARGVAALLTELPGPVLFQLTTRVKDPVTDDVVDRNLAITVGGCTATDPNWRPPPPPLESELRHLYERCRP